METKEGITRETGKDKGKRTRLIAYKWKCDRSCTVCGVKSKFRCSKCKCAFYCSKRHQQFDWAMHKKRCEIACSLVPDAGYLAGEAMLLKAAHDALRSPELQHVKEVLWDYRTGALSASALAPALAPALAYAQDAAQASELMGRLGCLHPHLLDRHREVMAALEKMRPKFEPARFPIISDPYGLCLLLSHPDNLDAVKVAAVDLLIDYLVEEVGDCSSGGLTAESLNFSGLSFFASVFKAGIDVTLTRLISNRYLKVPGWPDELHQLAIGLLHSFINWTCQILAKEKNTLLKKENLQSASEEEQAVALTNSNTTYAICDRLNTLFKSKLGKLYLLLSNVDHIEYMTPEEGKVWLKAFNALRPFVDEYFNSLTPLVQIHLLIKGFNSVTPTGNSRTADLYFSQCFFIHSIVTQGVEEFYSKLTNSTSGILRYIQADLRYRSDNHCLYSCLAVFESNLNETTS
mmetsp:Transcript_3456/g.4869  ORF Transcript_3456/g.4869 Transcript_3456/m.4869 type:complete len:461 (+) Transcript_3456:271-1653(+)